MSLGHEIFRGFFSKKSPKNHNIKGHSYDEEGVCTECGYDGINRPISYLLADGKTEMTLYDWKTVQRDMTSGWYLVSEDASFGDRMSASGEVNLILGDGATLTAKQGISVHKGSKLIIWCQKGQTGSIVATGNYGAGIGSIGSVVDYDLCGEVEINGGNIHAVGSEGSAGIGGGVNGHAGRITINGGNVYAKGLADGDKDEHEGAAGIGGGYGGNGGEIIINGGTITATADREGVGIGAGSVEGNVNITINGGLITATGQGNGPGIGGYVNVQGSITINGGTVISTSGKVGSGIGSGRGGNSSGLLVTITGGEVTATSISQTGAGIGGGPEGAYHIGGEGSNVNILGGRVIVNSNHTAIGHGEEDEVMGYLTIAEDMKVMAGNDGTNYERTFTGKERVGACNYHHCSLIEKCDHPDKEYVITTGWHCQNCIYCTVSFSKELHSFGEDGKCTVCGYEGYTFEEFKTHSLELSGNIALHFFLSLPEASGNEDSCYMDFNGLGATQSDKIDPEDRDLSGEGYYAFTCTLNAIQMAEPITAVLHHEDGSLAIGTYSVKKYIEDFEEKKDSFDETTTALVHAIADYGHYAQPALAAENGWKIGRDYAAMDTHFTEEFDYGAVLEASAPYKLTRILEDPKAQVAPVTLNLLSETELRFMVQYQEYEDGEVEASVDGVPVMPIYMGANRFLVQTKDIPAHRLDEEHVVCFTTKTGTVTVTTSPLGYIHEVLEKSSSKAAKDAASALYHYYKATKEYREAHGY